MYMYREFGGRRGICPAVHVDRACAHIQWICVTRTCAVHHYGCATYFRKERKMFETYQQQARTARDRKDKEDITVLRNQVGSTGQHSK